MASIAPEIPSQEKINPSTSLSDGVTGSKQPNTPEGNLTVSFNTKTMKQEFSMDESSFLEELQGKDHKFQSVQPRFKSQLLEDKLQKQIVSYK